MDIVQKDDRYKNKCFFCETELIFDNCENCSDLGYYDDEDDAIVYYFHCHLCGRSYEIVEPPIEEKEKEYKDYWGE